tara:strand:+ start:4018 stop:4254 length:237 start_codon:yes stop_codon:yes gene_type:complete
VFHLHVSYSLGHYEWGEPDVQLARAVGRTTDASGTDFMSPQRDLTWDFETTEELEDAIKRVNALNMNFLSISFTESQE